MALDANPRQIKRFVNSYLVLLEVGRGRGLDEESELLAGLVGLQLRWPAEYQAFTEAVFFGHEEPVLVLQRDDASNALTRYSARFLQHVPSTERIRRLLQLTETVGFLPTAESLPQGAAIHTGLAAELVKHGFSPVEGEPAIFTNPRSPNLRFVFGPTRVRAERRVRGRDWDVAGEFQPADMLNYGLTRFVPEYRPGGAAARQ